MPVSEKKLRSNPAWIKRHLTDPFVKKSVQEGYRARSVYKLMEIDDKDKIIKPGMSVVDLGAAPGSWTQIVKERLTDKDGKIDGKVIAMDILPMEPIEGVHFLQGDFREQEVADKLTDLLEGEKVDVVLSDMARTCRCCRADARCLLLNELALDFAKENLKKNGSFVCKVFQGSGYSQYVEACKKTFRKVSVRKPEASRSSSAEVYIVARDLK
ncbi:RlmE family RNA methyltransferase [Parasutterella sp.]|uniref:RlmE family RNA methyltransferase n=1 Tax=Parasutterella sp. TaxID=2049037 RepID=UPI0039936FA2